LPSFHPYWENSQINEKIELLDKLRRNIKTCSMDHSRIKYLYNKNTCIQDLIDRYKKLTDELDEYYINKYKV